MFRFTGILAFVLGYQVAHRLLFSIQCANTDNRTDNCPIRAT